MFDLPFGRRRAARAGRRSLFTPSIAAAALAIGLTMPLAGIASAQGGISPEDFSAPVNRTFVNIPTFGEAVPYQTTINVSGLRGTITDVNVRLRGLTHGRVSDVSIEVEHLGRAIVLMRGAGTGRIDNANLLFDETGPALPGGSTIAGGTYRPTDFRAGTPFGSPAPDPTNPNLDAFDGLSPNGSWTLWVRDDLTEIAGSLRGWQLEIVTTDDLPFIAIDTYRTRAGRRLVVDRRRGLLRSEGSPPTGNLTVELTTRPRKGKLKLRPDGSFTYDPGRNPRRRASFQYAVVDEFGNITSPGLVKIKIKRR